MRQPGQPARGLMMDIPLTTTSLIRHAARWHGATEVISRNADGTLHRYSYSDLHSRARRLAKCLTADGVAHGERLGTLAWNGHRHLELYFAISGIGAVCHTINPRLHPDQIVYIVNHAEDSQIYFDASFLALARQIAPRCPTVKRWVLLADPSQMPADDGFGPGLSCHEERIARHEDDFDWPELDELAASSLCYTSGTTGNPKGVLYSHRSTVLHAISLALPDATNLSARDAAMPIVPMFHVNAWGIPYACAAVGARLVLPGPNLDPGSLYDLLETQEVTFSAGVPTIWHALLQYIEANGLSLGSLRRALVGGAALPEATIRAYRERLGVSLIHAWGMTEVSPMGTVGVPLLRHRALTEEQHYSLLAKQGRPPYGVDIGIVDEHREDLPRDGAAVGNLRVRGPWVARSYFKDDSPSHFAAGWFDTGDVATIDSDGFLEISDRAKDIIKSGGEWISSIRLESLAMSHPGVAEAAAVAVPHPRWGERPLLVVVRHPGATVDEVELLRCIEGKVPRWWLPDSVVFAESLPRTATGKVMKAKLREEHASINADASMVETASRAGKSDVGDQTPAEYR